MSTEDGKRSPGQKLHSIPATVWNGMVGAGEAWSAEQLNTQKPANTGANPTDVVKVRNDTGGDLSRGDCIALDTFALTDLVADYLWFSGKQPTATVKPYGIWLDPTPDTKLGRVQLSGVCLAKLINSEPTFDYADAVEGQNQIETVACGSAHILYREEIGGQWWAVVRLSNPNCGAGCDEIRFKIITADPVAKTAFVQIQSRPNGCASVPEEIEDGTYGPVVNVCDPMGCLLNEPAADLVGRDGWAKYMLPIYVNTCQPTEPDIEPHWELQFLCCPSCVVP